MNDTLHALMMEECEKLLRMIGPRRTDEDLMAVCDSLNRISAAAYREGAEAMLGRTMDHLSGRVQ